MAAALHGEALEAGRIYVAPLITMCWCARVTAKSCAGRAKTVRVLTSIHSFAPLPTHYGNRVIGVVLIGQLDCGTAGFLAIKAHGGATIV